MYSWIRRIVVLYLANPNSSHLLNRIGSIDYIGDTVLILLLQAGDAAVPGRLLKACKDHEVLFERSHFHFTGVGWNFFSNFFIFFIIIIIFFNFYIRANDLAAPPKRKKKKKKKKKRKTCTDFVNTIWLSLVWILVLVHHRFLWISSIFI
jgi:hypothetical protein